MGACCATRDDKHDQLPEDEDIDGDLKFDRQISPEEVSLDKIMRDAGLDDGPVTRDHIESFCADEKRRKSVAKTCEIAEDKVQGVLMSVHETFEEAAHLHNFTKRDGFISVGGTLHVQTMLVSDAKKKASTLKGCEGFCFNSGESKKPVEIHFKNHFDTEVGWTTWTSFEICREDPPLGEFIERVSVTAKFTALSLGPKEETLEPN